MLNLLALIRDNNIKIIGSFKKLVNLQLSKLSYKYVNEILTKRLVNLFEIKHHDYNARNCSAPSIPLHGSKL